MSKLEFIGQVQESDGVFIILVPSSLSASVKDLKNKEMKVTIDISKT